MTHLNLSPIDPWNPCPPPKAPDLIAVLKGARDCLASLPEGHSYFSDIKRQLRRIDAALAQAERRK